MTDRVSWYKARRREKTRKIVFLLIVCLVLAAWGAAATVTLVREYDRYYRRYCSGEYPNTGYPDYCPSDNPEDVYGPVPAFFWWGFWRVAAIWIALFISTLFLIRTLEKPEGVP